MLLGYLSRPGVEKLNKHRYVDAEQIADGDLCKLWENARKFAENRIEERLRDVAEPLPLNRIERRWVDHLKQDDDQYPLYLLREEPKFYAFESKTLLVGQAYIFSDHELQVNVSTVLDVAKCCTRAKTLFDPIAQSDGSIVFANTGPDTVTTLPVGSVPGRV